MDNIILISDVLEHRKRKQKELAYYLERLEELKLKVFILNKEIDLTNRILTLIKKEEIIELDKTPS